MSCLFNGSVRMYYTRPSDQRTYCFEPVPLLGESKEFLKTDGGKELAIVHTLTFNGTLLPMMPELSGIPSGSTCISILDRKREQMCQALSEDRGDLLVVDVSGYPIISAKPIVRSLDFDQGTIVQQSPYSLVFEYEEVLDTGCPVRDFSENWSFNQNENDTVGVTHTISAVGIENTTLGTPPHIVAKDFVLSRLGYDSSQSYALRPPRVDALLDIGTLAAYNKIYTESSDITAGSYEVSETYVASSGAFLDDRTVEESYERDEERNFVRTLGINGTVQGYGDTTFDRVAAAESGFDNFVAPQIGFNDDTDVESKSKTVNRIAGTVSYSISRVPASGGRDDLIDKQITRSIARNDDGSVTQSVTTSARLRESSASGIQLAIDYCFDNNVPITSVEPIFDASLSGNILSINTDRDELQRSFSLTRVYTDQTTANYVEDYQVDVERQVDSSTVTVSIQGTVQGLGQESSTKSSDRFITASGAFTNIVEPLAFTRVAPLIPSGYCVSSEPTTESFGYTILGGTIAYSKSYQTRIKTSNPQVLSESIDISFELPSDVVAVIPIPGKPDGPVLQPQETVTGKTKSLTINYTMRREDATCSNSVLPSNTVLGYALAESDLLVNNTPAGNPRGEKPSSSAVFKTQDSVSFNRDTYQFTRSVTWQYL
jgi:hypothetical protein